MIITFKTSGTSAAGRYSFQISPIPDHAPNKFVGIIFKLDDQTETLENFYAATADELIRNLKEHLFFSRGLRIIQREPIADLEKQSIAVQQEISKLTYYHDY
jgi:hypothetical protein